MALTQTNKLKLLLAISLLFVCLFFFSLKCHVCLTLVIKKTKVRKKKLQISHGDVTCALCYFRHWF